MNLQLHVWCRTPKQAERKQSWKSRCKFPIQEIVGCLSGGCETQAWRWLQWAWRNSMCGGGNSRWEEGKAERSPLASPSSSGPWRPVANCVTMRCEAKWAAYEVCAGRPRFVRSSCLLSQYNVLQLRIYNHTERAPRIADFGRRLTGLLRNWMAIGMDLGFAIIHMQLLMLMFHIWSFWTRHPLFHYSMPLFTAQ